MVFGSLVGDKTWALPGGLPAGHGRRADIEQGVAPTHRVRAEQVGDLPICSRNGARPRPKGRFALAQLAQVVPVIADGELHRLPVQ